MSSSTHVTGGPVSPMGAMPVARAPDFKIIFSNQSRLRVGPGEFAITFGFQDQIPGGGALFLLEQTTVTMAPAHAKTMMLILKETVEAYEAQYGMIDLNPAAPNLDIAKILERVQAHVGTPKKD